MRWWFIPSRELTYPTWGKGKSSSKCHFWDMLVPWGVWLLLHILLILCLLFWGPNFTELWRKSSWVLIHLSLWMLLGLVGGACQLPLPHWNLHVVSSKTFCCFRLSLSTMTNITWYAAQTSSPKYKVSPPDVCIGLHKWRVAQHITSSHLGRSHSHTFYRGGKNLPACCMCKFHNHDSDG